jgi:hypothetical protein
MRPIVLGILALTICSLSAIAAPLPGDPKPPEPTAEELAAAKEAYAKHGGNYVDCASQLTRHCFFSSRE